MKIEDLKNASQSTKARNPELFGVGALPDTERECAAGPALGHDTPRDDQSPASVAIRVTVVSFRSHLLDSDNLTAGAKQLRDIIAEQLGIDDGDSRIEFEIIQVKTTGEQGAAVKIDMI